MTLPRTAGSVTSTASVVFVFENYKKAQPSLKKMKYNLYSSCCSTDLQGHTRSMIFFMSFESQYATFYLVIDSNLGRISHRFRDMASFSLQNALFLPPQFNPQFENVPPALYR